MSIDRPVQLVTSHKAASFLLIILLHFTCAMKSILEVLAVFPGAGLTFLNVISALHLFVNAVPFYIKIYIKTNKQGDQMLTSENWDKCHIFVKPLVIKRACSVSLEVHLWFIEGKQFIQTCARILIIFFWLLVACLSWISWPASPPAAITTLPSQWPGIVAWLPIMLRWDGGWILSTRCERYILLPRFTSRNFCVLSRVAESEGVHGGSCY